MSLVENVLLSCYQDGLTRAGLLRYGAAQRYAQLVSERFKVVSAGVFALARSLSGGNLQKFIVGREMATRPRVLLAAHPTWGVDVGAALAIRQALMDLAQQGAGVLAVSEDLAELFEISDRIAVLFDGRLSEPRRTTETSVDEVGLLMGGRWDAASVPASGVAYAA
jgi:simple sugar transport system ATP-binding protein